MFLPRCRALVPWARAPFPPSLTPAPQDEVVASSHLCHQSLGPSSPTAPWWDTPGASLHLLMEVRVDPHWPLKPWRATALAWPSLPIPCTPSRASTLPLSTTSPSPIWPSTKTPTPQTVARRRHSPLRQPWLLAWAAPTPSAPPHPCGTAGRCLTGTIGGGGVGGLGQAWCVELSVTSWVTRKKMISARGCHPLRCMLFSHREKTKTKLGSHCGPGGRKREKEDGGRTPCSLWKEEVKDSWKTSQTHQFALFPFARWALP